VPNSTTFVGLEKVTPSTLPVPVKTCDPSRYVVVKGHKYYDKKLGLCLPTGGFYESPSYDGVITTDGSYRTRFGYGVHFPWLVHSKTNHSLNNAFNNRILLVRPGEEGLRAAQATYLRTRSEIRELYSLAFAQALNDAPSTLTDIFTHIDDPHPKRQLRIDALNELTTSGEIGADSWLRNNTAQAKLKTDELSKTSEGRAKPGRIICDLGVKASLRGCQLTKRMKYAMNTSFVTTAGDEYQFCIKPNPEMLTEIFGKLMNPPHRSYFVYFSDDACYSIRDENGVVRIYNVDISKCDISHTPALFFELHALTPPFFRDTMTQLIDQCRADLTVTSPEDSQIKVRLKSANNDPHLLSGSTLTTLLNNLASVLVGERLNSTNVHTPEALIASVEKAGYIVTLEECKLPEDIQFLKHSPVKLQNGDYRPMLNLGVLLRATGICRGDLPGRGDVTQRAAYFQQQLLTGLYPDSSFPLIENMKRLVRDAKLGKKHTAKQKALVQKILARSTHHNTRVDPEAKPKGTAGVGVIYHFCEASMAARYQLTPSQLDELSTGLGSTGFGERHDSAASRAILYKDYGLEFLD
jgi:hypothetical protein